MSWQAEMLGIDLNQLKGERFSHPDHYAMVRAYELRAKAHQVIHDKSEFEVAADCKRAALKATQIADEMIVKQKRVQARRKAVATQKRRAGYEFTDAQLAIAMRSLG
jgi:hypothetical protein